MTFKPSSKRLYFIDAMRAWAILMMLQGHFIVGLLDKSYVADGNLVYAIWYYLRGMTAPIFFTVSGFIFTYLLLKNYSDGWRNPRIKKGLRRGIQLIIIGHLLQLYLPGLLEGKINSSFFRTQVLQCIGASILLIIGVYLLTHKRSKRLFSCSLLVLCLLSFIFKSVYEQWDFSFLPPIVANYFTTTNGSIFIIFPWFGYAAFGGFLSVLFKHYGTKQNFYITTILAFALIGYLLSHFATPITEALAPYLQKTLFENINTSGFLFTRLGNVLLVFSIFMLLRSLFKKRIVVQIGGNTLAIYVIHSLVLYGTPLGLGLTKFYHQSLPPSVVIPGVFVFMVLITLLALMYDRYKEGLKKWLKKLTGRIKKFW